VEKSEGHVRAYHAAYLHCCAAVLCAHPAIREGSEFDPIGAGRRKALGSKGGAEWGAKVLKHARRNDGQSQNNSTPPARPISNAFVPVRGVSMSHYAQLSASACHKYVG
jgi:hypothetical protein